MSTQSPEQPIQFITFDQAEADFREASPEADQLLKGAETLAEGALGSAYEVIEQLRADVAGMEIHERFDRGDTTYGEISAQYDGIDPLFPKAAEGIVAPGIDAMSVPEATRTLLALKLEHLLRDTALLQKRYEEAIVAIETVRKRD